ncbi:CHAT domain-containing tetratricopeptide repeat protein [Ancylothrix sp. C2]|uniref:CHAT domain-containing protein n=1 Tax=Ancylothrix sp. D3o TaxID=2953691 RepID=UPI0021BB80E8|nr:CHAT domain-containing tetratricopeptide repeat protein [Ancylothrix sp. D3o]MCT7949129.1 CHAT domain-containing tetratricopeptide repeat protein [Ancylothrix sp. D3o]
MFRHLRQWFIKAWHRFLGLFRKPQPTNSPTPQFTDADYEKLFFQLLKVVNSGMMGEQEALWCVESLKQPSSEAEWVQWLGRFGDRLLASDAPNRELAEKMVKLGEVNGGQLTEMAGNIGRELLSRCAEEGPVALEISSDAIALFYRGVDQHLADDFNGALASYEKAIDIEPKFHLAWHNKGAVLTDLGRYEEALASYQKAIEIEPKFHNAWNGKGVVLSDLGRYEEALASYQKAIEIEPKFHHAWNGKGRVLSDLGQNEEALASYEKAIKIEPNYHPAWNGKGCVLSDWGRYEEAIIAFNRALQLTNNQDWQAWANWGVAIIKSQRYDAAIENWDEGLQNIPANELEGRARLHQCKGNAHYEYARFQLNRYPYLNKARNSYIDALKTLSNCQNDILGEILSQPCPPHLIPLYLEILQKLAKVCKALGNQKEFEYCALGNQKEFEYCLNIGDQLLEELLKTQSNEQKIRLSRKYASFNQLRVLLYAQSPKPEEKKLALKLSQQRKNLCLRWMQKGWVEMETPELTIPPGVALLDWHYSDAGIVVFILRNDEPLKVCILTSQIPQILDNSADRLVGEFEEWMKQWQENYEKQRGKKEDQTETQEWQNAMVEELEKLRKILQIDDQILRHLRGIDHLILIPHRHLHLLPLEYFFQNQKFTISRLPSLQMGIDLENSPNSAKHLLNVQSPSPLLFAELESNVIAHFYQNNLTFIPSKKATLENVINNLQTNIGIFHFTGHAGHDFNNPKNSALNLKQKPHFTLEEIFKLDFSQYFIISLSACETGLTSKPNLIDEYVGLVSGFLSSKASYVLSTLWQVQELSAALIMIEFYREINKDNPPIIALKNAQNWLRTVTLEKLAQWCEELASEIGEDNDSYDTLIAQANQAKQQIAIMGKDDTPYKHPYHWAGVIITGKINL